MDIRWLDSWFMSDLILEMFLTQRGVQHFKLNYFYPALWQHNVSVNTLLIFSGLSVFNEQ